MNNFITSDELGAILKLISECESIDNLDRFTVLNVIKQRDLTYEDKRAITAAITMRERTITQLANRKRVNQAMELRKIKGGHQGRKRICSDTVNQAMVQGEEKREQQSKIEKAEREAVEDSKPHNWFKVGGEYEMDYVDVNERRTKRTIIVKTKTKELMYVYCFGRNDYRTFRFDRVLQATHLVQPKICECCDELIDDCECVWEMPD